MASGYYRMNRKTAANTYEEVLPKSHSGIIYRPNGRTVEQDLVAYLPEYQASDTVPKSLQSGKFLITSDNRIYYGGLNNTVQEVVTLAHELHIVLDSAPSLNTKVTSMPSLTISQLANLANISGCSVDTIISKLKANGWPGSGGSSSGGSTGGGSEGTIVTESGGGSVPASSAPGTIVTIGGHKWIVVHRTTDTVYVIMKTISETIVFNDNNSTTYNNSTIHKRCKTFYQDSIPTAFKNSGILKTITEGYVCPVFIPTLAQVASTTIGSNGLYQGQGSWSYFSEDNKRVTTLDGSAYPWWLQSQWPTNSSYVCYVGTDGYVNYNYPDYAYGFRPALAISRSAFA